MKQASNQCRQGDVFLFKNDGAVCRKYTAGKILNENSPRLAVLQLGAVTTHSHRVEGNNVLFHEVKETAVINGSTPDRLLVLTEDSVLAHEEHGNISLTAGGWVVRIQREFDPTTNRNVYD